MAEKLAAIISPVGAMKGAISVPENIVEKDYKKLQNKPSVNGVELTGNKTIEDLGEETLTNMEISSAIDKMFNLVFKGGNK